ncbi:glycoside hydrolase family 79 protein [Macroventuria anomochaeta]|uniref:Glycoside hydrolase family 79 protein n=1 Tax=Macroventuria anomochaeta TaxID=301207 RepID=A0ACB6SA34_9PLEO|nr:glycoside hydrolase family 79 protein [Macroventuria anomochaeta]KAF2631155.1 glycoside hydrolase family 79 protein [Macroventuria anomochaeta]
MVPSLSAVAGLGNIALPLLSLLQLVLAQSSISLSPSSSAPDGASEYLDASFAGFGIEPSNLFSFTGGDTPNQLSIKLLQNLADYSGAPPHIRLGGNTQDYMLYESNYTDIAWEKNPSSTAQGNVAADSMIIGPGYFEALNRFPKDTPVTYGLNLAYMEDDWEDRIVAAAQGAVSGMTNVKLYSFEVGNEPDLWLQNTFRTAPWNGQVYTTQFLDRAEAVYTRVLQPAGLPSSFFEPPATASTIGTTFEISQLVSDGMMEGRNGDNYVTVWNQHDYFYFIGVTKTPITLNDLMQFDQTNTQFAYWEKQVKIGLKTGLPYVLREMSSIGPIGMPGVSDAFGASLWTLNFFLYAASLDISSVQMHMTDNSNASAWQPITLYGRDPFVRTLYYAHAAMAQIVGNGNGTTQIASMSTSNVGSSYDGRIRAYSMYAHDNLQAVIMLNGKQANESQSDKGSFTFNVNFGSSNANKDVYLSYLTADGADSQTGATWNGMTYSDTTGESSVVDSTVHTITLDGSGKAAIPVRDSQAVVANIGWQIGSTAVLKSDGSTARKSNAGLRNTPTAFTAVCAMIATTFALVASSA